VELIERGQLLWRELLIFRSKSGQSGLQPLGQAVAR
jgi:hypothetical protein